MATRKMIWGEEAAVQETEIPSGDTDEAAPEIAVSTEAPAVDESSSEILTTQVVKALIEDGRNKVSEGLPEWTLMPPSLPIKRLVRKR